VESRRQVEGRGSKEGSIYEARGRQAIRKDVGDIEGPVGRMEVVRKQIRKAGRKEASAAGMGFVGKR